MTIFMAFHVHVHARHISTFLLLCFMAMIYTSSGAEFYIVHEKSFLRSVTPSSQVGSQLRCIMKCLRASGCNSVNMQHLSSGQFDCHLQGDYTFDQSELSDTTDWTYASKIEAVGKFWKHKRDVTCFRLVLPNIHEHPARDGVWRAITGSRLVSYLQTRHQITGIAIKCTSALRFNLQARFSVERCFLCYQLNA